LINGVAKKDSMPLSLVVVAQKLLNREVIKPTFQFLLTGIQRIILAQVNVVVIGPECPKRGVYADDCAQK
jgi:hypothetical protein